MFCGLSVRMRKVTEPFLLDASGLLPRVAKKDGSPSQTTLPVYIATPVVILQQNNGLVKGAAM